MLCFLGLEEFLVVKKHFIDILTVSLSNSILCLKLLHNLVINNLRNTLLCLVLLVLILCLNYQAKQAKI